MEQTNIMNSNIDVTQLKSVVRSTFKELLKERKIEPEKEFWWTIFWCFHGDALSAKQVRVCIWREKDMTQ
jgi:hypothetical protein